MNMQFVRDAGERLGKAFVGAFLSVYFAAGINLSKGTTQISVLQKAALAGMAAVASLVMSFLSRWVGTPGTASLTRSAPPAPPAH